MPRSGPKYRTMWMFPRCIRNIAPWKLSQIALLLDSCAGNTSAQNVQDALYDQLGNLGVKIERGENGIPNHGGMRTYFAQLVCLGLFFRDENKIFHPTLAGEEMISANNPLRVLRCQLLRMQYPSVYGNSTGVSVSPDLKVKPFCFLIKLLCEERLEKKLSTEDIAVAVVYGRKDSDYGKVVDKILALRREKEFKKIIDTEDDLKTPRRYKGNSLLDRGIKDAEDIANTARNYMSAAQLIVPCEGDTTFCELFDEQNLMSEISGWLAEGIEKAPLKGYEVAWQRRYGRYNKAKDTRRIEESKPKEGMSFLLRSRFISEIQGNPYGFDADVFCQKEVEKWGIPLQEVVSAVSVLREKTKSIERETVIKAAISGGKEAVLLEKAIAEIFKRLGFDLTEHIAQRKAHREGGYPDLRIRATGITTCGFGDAKATVRYEFPLTETSKLASYYRNCWNEFEDKTPSAWFLYIAGGFRKKTETVMKNLRECQQKYGHPVSAITVETLLDLADLKNPPSVYDIDRAFKTGGFFTGTNLNSFIE